MRILILGGIAEAKQLAISLTAQSHHVIYSLAGKVRRPSLPCEVRTGGFSNGSVNGIVGLQQYCRQNHIDLLIDATHPYAQNISANAATASDLENISCWRFERPSWQVSDFPNWHSFDSFESLWPQLEPFNNVFFSIGLSALEFVEYQQPKQHWIVRSAQLFENIQGVTQINAVGPFSYVDELALLQQHNVDSLVCKNSGSDYVVEKLNAAKTLGIPIFVRNRPKLPAVTKTFDGIDSIVTEINKGHI